MQHVVVIAAAAASGGGGSTLLMLVPCRHALPVLLLPLQIALQTGSQATTQNMLGEEGHTLTLPPLNNTY
jgi:hypothetical protein